MSFVEFPSTRDCHRDISFGMIIHSVQFQIDYLSIFITGESSYCLLLANHGAVFHFKINSLFKHLKQKFVRLSIFCYREMSDDEYLSKKHNPDMSDAAWDKRWEKAKEVKLKARERERRKIMGDDEDGGKSSGKSKEERFKNDK